VTFYTGVEQLPPFEDYGMRGRTYRYFVGKPLYPFGYGLSYTRFGYGGLKLSRARLRAGAPLSAEVEVRNAGPVAGDEVVQIYLGFPQVPGAPIRALRGVQRVRLAPGETRRVRFALDARGLSSVTPAGARVVAPGRYTVSVGGGQPGTGAPGQQAAFRIQGTAAVRE
jgi:beta-glucosidase